MASNLKFIMKRHNGTDLDVLYPKTIIAQVDGLQSAIDAKLNASEKGSANGVATLDASSHLTASQIPTWLMNGSPHHVGSFSTATSNLSDFVTTLLAGLVSGQSVTTRYGWFYQVTNNTNLTWVDNTPTGVTYSVRPGDEGDEVSPITLEAGDLVVFTDYYGGTNTFKFSIINNTYGVATPDSFGIVKTAGQVQGMSQLENNGGVVVGDALWYISSDGDSYNIESQDKIMLGGHTHSNYQPLDADLTALAGLAVTDGNFIVGNGSTWVVESGSTARASLGLGSLATLSAVNNTHWSGTDLAVANGGTGASDAAGARTNLGLVIGTNVQAYDAKLAAIAELTPTDSNIIVGNGTTWVAETGATARTSLGAQAASTKLDAIAALAVTDGNFIVGNGTTWVAESSATARASLGVYSTTQVDAFIANRPEIYYNTTTGVGSGDLIIADVVAV